MELLQVSHGVAPVDPLAVGSVSAHVGTLCNALSAQTHSVNTTLIGRADSIVQPNIPIIPLPHSTSETSDTNVQKVLATIPDGRFDALHAHIKPSEGNLETLKKMSTHMLVFMGLHIDPNSEERKAIANYPNFPFIAFSQAQASRFDHLNLLGVVNHGVNTNHLQPPAHEPTGNVALIIGKIYPGKNTHTGISAAKEAGFYVKVAGPIVDEVYFNQSIAPLLGTSAEYMGVVTNGEKRKLYGSALITVCPSELPETFGLVLAESMACGTPVAALPAGGSYEEILQDGGGICVHNSLDLVEAIGQAANIPRAVPRESAVKNFSAEVMANKYITLISNTLG